MIKPSHGITWWRPHATVLGPGNLRQPEPTASPRRLRIFEDKSKKPDDNHENPPRPESVIGLCPKHTARLHRTVDMSEPFLVNGSRWPEQAPTTHMSSNSELPRFTDYANLRPSPEKDSVMSLDANVTACAPLPFFATPHLMMH
ncbi:hypothetical protein MRX96_021310 [Rhipicephalus microplus]